MFLLFGLAIWLFTSIEVAMAQPPVSVGVYGEHYGGKLVYHYRLTNNSPDNIPAIWIGHDTKNDSDVNNDTWELVELPAGWDFKAGIPAGSATSPPGWKVYMITPEEIPGNAIAWETVDDNSPDLVPGQTFNQMSVTLNKADSNYITGHAFIQFPDRPQGPTTLTVPLDRLDITPPTLSVTLSPATIWPPDNKLVAVTAAITVKDDYDPAPEIQLVSITSNETLAAGDIQGATVGTDVRQFQLKAARAGNNLAGRIYTVTYSATDGSGNKSIATATLTVPHDQGK